MWTQLSLNGLCNLEWSDVVVAPKRSMPLSDAGSEPKRALGPLKGRTMVEGKLKPRIAGGA